MKRILALLLTCLLALGLFAACGGEPANLVGAWGDDENSTAILEFKEDGTYTYMWMEDGDILGWGGTYEVKGKQITITDDTDPDEVQTNSFSVKDNKLTMNVPLLGGAYTLIGRGDPDPAPQNDGGIVGLWSDDSDDTAILSFEANGAYTYSWLDDGDELSWSGTYVLNGGEMTVTNDEDLEVLQTDKFSVEGSTLTIEVPLLGGTYQKIEAFG